MRCALRADMGGVKDKVIAARILPVDIEERPEPAGSHPIQFFKELLRGVCVKSFLSFHLVNSILHRRNHQHLEHMTDAWKKFLPASPVIDEFAPLSYLTHGRLQSNAIQPQAFEPALPPPAFGFQDLRKLCLRNAVAPACLHQNFSAHATIVQDGRDSFSNCFATTKSRMR